MKHYNKQDLAYAAARRHIARHGGSAAVIETEDLPGTFQVGTMGEVRTRRESGKVTSCKLFYGVSSRRHHGDKSKAPAILEIDTALGTYNGGFSK